MDNKKTQTLSPNDIQDVAPPTRRSALGAMQRPPLDGPVDLRPLAPPAPSRCAASGAEQG